MLLQIPLMVFSVMYQVPMMIERRPPLLIVSQLRIKSWKGNTRPNHQNVRIAQYQTSSVWHFLDRSANSSQTVLRHTKFQIVWKSSIAPISLASWRTARVAVAIRISILTAWDPNTKTKHKLCISRACYVAMNDHLIVRFPLMKVQKIFQKVLEVMEWLEPPHYL